MNLKIKLPDVIFAVAVAIVVAFSLGYSVGTHDAKEACLQGGGIIECDTDMDCVEKNGCGEGPDSLCGEVFNVKAR